MVVEAMADPVGLKMGVIVSINLETQELIYQRFQCKNEAIFNISEITGEDISFYGGEVNRLYQSFSSYLNCSTISYIFASVCASVIDNYMIASRQTDNKFWHFLITDCNIIFQPRFCRC